MGFATVITWFATVLLGLFMLTVWLIENDVTGHGVAPSRLPVPVILAHLGLAATGLTVWVAFLVVSQKTLAWAAVGILGAIAVLGATMFARWIPVYRGPARPAEKCFDTSRVSMIGGSAGWPAARPLLPSVCTAPVSAIGRLSSPAPAARKSAGQPVDLPAERG